MEKKMETTIVDLGVYRNNGKESEITIFEKALYGI